MGRGLRSTYRRWTGENRATRLGLGLTISGLVTFALAVPLGRFADRLGAQRMWALGALCEAGLYLVYPWIHGFAAERYLAPEPVST